MKKNWIKWFALMLVAALLAVGAVSCAKTDGTEDTVGETVGETLSEALPNVTDGATAEDTELETTAPEAVTEETVTEESLQESSEGETVIEADSLTEDETSAETDAETEDLAEETQAETEVADETDVETQEDTVAETEIEIEIETEVETEDPATRINELTDAAHVTFYDSRRPRLNSVLKDAQQCKYEIVMDATYGSVLKLTTLPNASDPFISFYYHTYVQGHKLTQVSADEYKYVVMTIKVDKCASETFELFYAAGGVTGPTAGYQTSAAFLGSDKGWQKIVFDLSNKDFSGAVNMFRFDFFTSGSVEGGDTMYIYSMDFYKSRSEAYADLGIDMTRPGEGSTLTETPVSGVNYNKVNAPDEDGSVKLWFDHMTEKVYQNDTTSSGMDTYVISMAGNSIENCQFFLAPRVTRHFRIEMTPFTNAAGNALRTEILREHYVNINGNMVPDALPPLSGTVTVNRGNSQGFVIKVWADANEAAGLYSAVLNIYDADTGKHIKKANVYVRVWDFSLSDETALKTAVGLNDGKIVQSYQNKGMNHLGSGDLYKAYYDFLLENRLCAYRLPYSVTDARCQAYLNNPRVTSFAINKSDSDESAAYQVLKNNPVWMEKGYFYYVDEPYNMDLLNNLANAGNRLSSTFPGYQQVSPFFTNIQVNENTDQISFMTPYTNIWCTKPFAFTPRDKYRVPGAQYMTTTEQDAKYGTFAQRMAALQRQGHELWLYVCWEPEQPYVNWLALGDGTEPIVSIWQCAMTNATGFLYWEATWWNDVNNTMNDLTPLIGATAHGDGVLIYSGSEIGSYQPISSMRLETVRLGIQDYQMLSMLEAKSGAAKADQMIAMVTTDVITYTNDDDYLHAVRVLLGKTVNQAMRR